MLVNLPIFWNKEDIKFYTILLLKNVANIHHFNKNHFGSIKMVNNKYQMKQDNNHLINELENMKHGSKHK
jgi:hypothetical protein